jgi:hypothetical protein
MIYAKPSASFEAVVQGFPTGLTGTVGVQIVDNVGGVTVARTTTGITETPSGSGIYTKTLAAPSSAGQYTVVWDKGVVNPMNVASEDLSVAGALYTRVRVAGDWKDWPDPAAHVVTGAELEKMDQAIFDLKTQLGQA